MPVNATPKVSVVLTSYNHEKYIAKAIDSVLAQTFTDFELIISDDCSTDTSWDIIQSYKDPRIHAIRAQKQARTKTFYDAVHSAKGQYLAIHHSDDMWLPEKLEKQVRHLDAHPEHVAVFTQGHFIDELGDSLGDWDWFSQHNRSRHKWLRDFFFKGNLLSHPTVLMHREHAHRIYSTYGPTGTNDWRAWVQTCLEHEIFVIQEKLFLFCLHPNGANDGGQGLGSLRRFEVDLPWILELYRNIPTFEEWQKVFPECADYLVNGEFDPDYFFAMFCLEQDFRPARTYFSINLLMRAMNDKEKRERLDRLYNFTAAQMAKVAAEHDPFGLSIRANYSQAQAALTHTEAALKQTQAALSEKDALLHSVIHSRSWRITKPLRELAIIARKIIKTLRSI